MPSPLESLTDDLLDRISVEYLGDTFTFTPAGGQPVTGVNGFVEYGEEVANPVMPSPGAVAQSVVIELAAAKFPGRPTDACRISGLHRLTGATFKPIGVTISDRGFWRFSIQRVPG